MKKTTELRKILAKLFPTEADGRRIAEDAQLESARINFGSSAINNWHAILREAENCGQTNALIEVVLAEYPQNPELVDALKIYGYHIPQEAMPPVNVPKARDLELSQSEQEELQSAFLHAFTPSSLTQMLRLKLGENLVAITQGNNFTDDVFNLIQWSIQQGRLLELIRGACVHNPTNPKLKPFCSRANQVEKTRAWPKPPVPTESSQSSGSYGQR